MIGRDKKSGARNKLMKMIQNILFPVDFSASCVAIAPFVKRAVSIASTLQTFLIHSRKIPCAAS